MVPKRKFSESDVLPVFDLRFRSLLPRRDWDILPAAVKVRFSKRLAGGETAIYTGRVTEIRTSRAGRVIAQLLRLIGAPLPIFDHVDVPSVVTVTEDARSGGQVWTRLYANRAGFPQVIHSAKRFSGPTGLEEYVGFGISMALTVAASEKGLTFSSAGFALSLGGYRMPIPRFLAPGQLTVTHMETQSGRFTFDMKLTHPVLGELIYQAADYGDVASW